MGGRARFYDHVRVFRCLPAFLFSLALLFPLILRADPPPTRQDQAWTAAQRSFNRRQWAPAETAYTEFRRDYGVDERALEALYRIGITRARRNNTDGAITAWRDVLRSPANRPAERDTLLRALAQLFSALDPDRDRHERDQILNRLARTFPDDKTTTIRLHAAEGRRRFENADIAGATRLLALVEPHLNDADRDLLAVARAHAGRGTLSASLIMQLADSRLESREHSDAVPLYELALRAAPTQTEEIELRTKYGWSHYLEGNHGEAENQWRRVIERTPRGNPWRGRSRWHLAVLHAGHKNDVKTAIALCEEQADEFAGHFLGEQALFSQAWLLMISEKWQEALENFQRLVAAYPRSADNPHVQSYIAHCEQNLENRQ